ncbi:unnamed protein product [Timema podura]|nr:unnamed protein product [Timema douglasi]CAD7462968.1 unnamed protein product [Timema tahoe]CAG2056110.1 unnamed protein product [Timema podura]
MLSNEEAAQRDRAVRLHSVHTDLELDLPPNIALPDGEEIPYGSATRLHIRDTEQEREIYQKCIRPPPNRTVFDGESPPPYRSCSAGLLSLGGSSDWSSSDCSGVIRCHSMSSSSKSIPPAVLVPSRTRRLSAFSDARDTGGGTLANLTMVPCKAEPRTSTRR